jgi:alkylation response protein AidB-like acyl-CoA dehydrogenase
MSQPTRNNPYRFSEFLDWRNQVDYYADDPFIQAVLKKFAGNDWNQIDKCAREISRQVSYRWRDMADQIARPEERPYIVHFDGHNNRVDRIVRPEQSKIMEKEIFAEGLFAPTITPWEKLIKMYLIYQNGEAGVACPLTCTEGLVEIIARYADTPELQRILQHCREGINGDFGIGAQYLSEIQGGSDVPANVLEAVYEEGQWRLLGSKFFCSAAHADYALITAKPQGAETVALFAVPAWLPGNKAKEKRNSYIIDRIKWKMGTGELVTAEITFQGALAYPVGPLNRGLANMVGIVLSYSRLTVGLSAAAFMTRAVREAKQYAAFREQFGLKIGRFPLLAGQIAHIEAFAQRTTAGAFKLYQEMLALPGGIQGGLPDAETETVKKKRFQLRELIMLQKVTAAWDCTDVIRRAMSIFGGHGVIEDFSVLPRLYRDAAVNELWEGPRNVLLTQMHRDFQKVSAWFKPSELVEEVLEGYDPTVIEELAGEITTLVDHPSLLPMDAKTMEICERWDNFCQAFFHAYQNLALAEVMG